jgi:hypothetical protein
VGAGAARKEELGPVRQSLRARWGGLGRARRRGDELERAQQRGSALG